MTKRKEYLETADRVVRELVLSYYKDHGKFPNGYSVLKSALTRSYNNLVSDVYDKKYKHSQKYDEELEFTEAFKLVLKIKE